jgi:nicotinamidase/pyrazinamidase
MDWDMKEIVMVSQIGPESALLVVDMQYDFLPGGALAVKNANEIIDPINEVIDIFYAQQGKIVFTQDWHPNDHHSFASTHTGKKPGDPIINPGLGPILWPDHCVQNTYGAQIHEKMHIEKAIAIIRKGYTPQIDSYSAFVENDKQTKTGLASFLRELKIKTIFICGLATDYCCYYSAMDGIAAGFDVVFIENLTRGIDLPEGNMEKVKKVMQKSGIKIMDYQKS